jgi:hypothetical protein
VDAAPEFVVSFTLTAVAFQVQTKLVGVIVIDAFVAEPWRSLGLGLLLDQYGHGNATVMVSTTFCLGVSDLWNFFLPHCLDLRFTVKMLKRCRRSKEKESHNDHKENRTASPETPDVV